MWESIIIVAVVAVIVILAGLYVYREKKRGKRCIGCPSCCTADAKKGTCSGDGCSCKEK